ncbi:19409_t:CDS:2, partial [Racocetra persica]
DWEIKKDRTKLKEMLLSDDEWELLDKLIDLLMLFEEATREFLGNIYIILSKDTIFESDNEDMQPIDFNDDDII